MKYFHQCLLLIQNQWSRTSLVVQWIRIRLPAQGTRVWSLVREDPTYCKATKACVPGACAPQQKSPQWEACAPPQRTARPCHSQRKLAATKLQSSHNKCKLKNKIKAITPKTTNLTLSFAFGGKKKKSSFLCSPQLSTAAGCLLISHLFA